MKIKNETWRLKHVLHINMHKDETIKTDESSGESPQQLRLMKSSEHWNWCFFISYQLSVVSCHRQTAEAERNVWFVRQQLQRSVRVFNGICAGVDFTGGWRCCCCSCFSSSTVRNSLKSECRLFALTAGWSSSQTWSCLLQGLYAH